MITIYYCKPVHRRPCEVIVCKKKEEILILISVCNVKESVYSRIRNSET